MFVYLTLTHRIYMVNVGVDNLLYREIRSLKLKLNDKCV